jgi:hypothetical protein
MYLDDKLVTGYKTAITRKNISLPVRYLLRNKLLYGSVIDYGCGRGFDCDHLKYDGYDPYYRDIPIKDHYDVGICTYVLNVVDKTTQTEIIEKLKNLTDVCYISVRRDLPKEGKKGNGCWQSFVELNEQVIHQNSKFIIYKLGGKDDDYGHDGNNTT